MFLFGQVNVVDGVLNTAATTFTQTGTLDVAAGKTFQRTGGFTNGGTLSGSGIFDVGAGNALVNNGTVKPGGAAAIGTLGITGNYSQGPGGTLDVELQSGASFDVLSVSGTATLNGTLNVSYLGGYIGSGAGHSILAYGARAGTFGAINDPNALIVNYAASALSLGSPFNFWISSDFIHDHTS